MLYSKNTATTVLAKKCSSNHKRLTTAPLEEDTGGLLGPRPHTSKPFCFLQHYSDVCPKNIDKSNAMKLMKLLKANKKTFNTVSASL